MSGVAIKRGDVVLFAHVGFQWRVGVCTSARAGKVRAVSYYPTPGLPPETSSTYLFRVYKASGLPESIVQDMAGRTFATAAEAAAILRPFRTTNPN